MGIYKTENKGRTWRKINNGIKLTGQRPTVYDIQVDPQNGNNIYLVGITNNYGKIYKSTNGGEEWREVFVESQKEKTVYYTGIALMIGSTAGAPMFPKAADA